MRISWIAAVVMLGHVSATVASSQAGVLGEQCLPERAVPCLTPLFDKLKATRDFSALKEEIKQRLATGDERVRDATLGWIEMQKAELTDAETADFEELYLEVSPNGPGSRGFRTHVATLRLSQLRQSQRAGIYWEAVRNGKADIGGVDPLVRAVALGMAAREGLIEFTEAITQYADELNRGQQPLLDGTTAGRLLWQMRLYAGAHDAKDATRLQAARLSSMDALEFRSAMTHDADFRGEVTLFLGGFKPDRGSEPSLEDWKNIASVFLKQDALQRELAGKTSEAAPASGQKKEQAEPDWLVRMRTATQGRVRP